MRNPNNVHCRLCGAASVNVLSFFRHLAEQHGRPQALESCQRLDTLTLGETNGNEDTATESRRHADEQTEDANA